MASTTKSNYYSQHDQNQQQEDQYYILLPFHPRRSNRTRHLITRCLSIFLSLLLISLLIFLLFPSDPKINIARLHLNHIKPNLSPFPTLDISLDLLIKVRNIDFFSLNYTCLIVSIGYRGRQLGYVSSEGGYLKARASSYVNATLVLDGIQVIHDVFYLIEDLAKGEIPFDTVTQVSAKLGFFFFEVPIMAKVSCEVYVDVDNQTITRQDCYPE